MRLLVVDDSEDAQDLAAVILESGGYTDITFASSGEEALRLLDINGRADPDTFDAIFLDILMPGTDGIETCARIRSDPRLQDLPVIMVSSMNEESSLSQAFVAGANDYITKPYNRTEMLARLRGALKLRAELKRRKLREAELLDVTNQMRSGRRASAGSAARDALTGLMGRRTAEALADQHVDGAEPALSVVAAQIDALPHYRQRHSEDEVNTLIAALARRIASIPAALGDIVTHFEPGIFVIFLDDHGDGRAESLAEAVTASLREARIPQPESRHGSQATVSVGVASAASRADQRTLFSKAFGAMEASVDAGGNRITHATTTRARTAG